MPASLDRRDFAKLLGGALAAMPVTSILAGCSNSAPANSSATNESNASSTSRSNDAASEPAGNSGSGSKMLVAYFSATGHTKAAAQAAANALGADLFEITPVNPYTDEDLNYSNPESRVDREHDDESLRNVELAVTTPNNFEDYETVLLGYPIWWGVAAWPTNGFASGNDFTGKRVVPFCTSLSSPIGQSGSNLADLAGTGTWEEGQRFSENVSADEVADWAVGLTQ